MVGTVRVLFLDNKGKEISYDFKIYKIEEIWSIERLFKSKEEFKDLVENKGYTYIGWYPLDFETEKHNWNIKFKKMKENVNIENT